MTGSRPRRSATIDEGLPAPRTCGFCGEPSASMPTVCLCMAKKYKEVRRLLLASGWSVVRQAGSHEVWAHPDREDRIVVAGKDSDTVPVGTLGSIRRASGLQEL